MSLKYRSGNISFRAIPPARLAGFCFILLLIPVSCGRDKPVDLVDPFICTEGDHGHWLPAALVPFGLVELCPDTWPGSLTADGDLAHSGYDFSDDHIRGFSHLHRGSSGGTAVTDRSGLISILPFTESRQDTFFLNPVVEIDKRTEKAEPGYYTVTLPGDGIKAELTATKHSGIHRYTFPSDSEKRLFLYSGNSGERENFSCRVTGSNCLEGSVGNKFFFMKFNIPLTEIMSPDGKSLIDQACLEDEVKEGLIVGFGSKGKKSLIVRTGISLTSVEAARKNLIGEAAFSRFRKIRREAHREWNRVLETIRIKGDDAENKTIFYTALYHTCFLPVIQSDADGAYSGLDRKIHKSDGFVYYDGYAFWDSFRTKYPLYSLFLPSVYSDIVISLSSLYRQADNWSSLPGSNHPPHGVIYKAAGEDGYQIFASCRHEHMLMVVADAIIKGISKVDIDSVYPFMKREVMLQMPEKYDSIGFIPARPDQTGEYCWDNWTLAQIAHKAGNKSDYDYLMKRSDYWRNTWDPTIKYFRARSADGTWLDFPEDPAMNREKYTYEGSKWHWRWNVIHDIPALIDCFGGKEKFVDELEFFFENDLYTAGNQIDLQAPFLFNMAGSPWLTQKWVRRLLTEPIVQLYGTHGFFTEPIVGRIYKSTPDGYLEEMDDDYGCMAAWYAMSAMGLYQVCPGNPVYQVTAPIFDEVSIKLDKSIYVGKKFIIKAIDLNEKNIYIQSATLNGDNFSRSFIKHDEITHGGKLVFVMGDKPNKEWGLSGKFDTEVAGN